MVVLILQSFRQLRGELQDLGASGDLRILRYPTAFTAYLLREYPYWVPRKHMLCIRLGERTLGTEYMA